MNKHLTTIFWALLFFHVGSNAQVFSLGNGFINGDVITTCSGTFKDSNVRGRYSNDEDYVVTFSPATLGKAIELRFDSLALGAGDSLWIFDGANTSAPILSIITATDDYAILRASSKNASGALTIHFISDDQINNFGWSAAISCKIPCQKVEATIFSTTPQADAQGYINICKGQAVLFEGKGNYPDNNLLYHQSDSLSRFAWKTTDNTESAGTFLNNFTHRFNNEGGYTIDLRITDSIGCVNTSKAFVKVRTSLTPVFNAIVPPTICSSDSFTILTNPRMGSGNFSTPPITSDSIFLPDGTGATYQTSIDITQFAPGQTLTAINNLKGILINMEHSWLGDLEITLRAPNGKSVRLKHTAGTGIGWDSFLGEPVDEPLPFHPFDSIIGKGYSYVFTTDPTYGTMPSEKGKHQYTYTDNAGQLQAHQHFLPSGSYAAEESMDALVGTQLNGKWTLTIKDLFPGDNGYLFFWTLQFDPSIFPTPEMYHTQIVSTNWTSSIISNATDTTATLFANSAGHFPLSYSIADDYGCIHDTTFNITIIESPAKPNLGEDTLMCNGRSVALNVANVQGNQVYTWSTGDTGTTSISITQPGEYLVETTTILGCSNRDTIVVNLASPFVVSLGNDTSYCESSPLILSPNTSVPVSSYLWSDQSSGSTLQTSRPGIYWVEATDNSSCKVRDTIVLSPNPINNFELPTDTSICEDSKLLVALSPPAGTIITWNDGTVGETRSLSEGAYNIEANYQGCLRNSQFNIVSKPLPKINLGSDTSKCPGLQFPLSVIYPGATYLWNTGSTSNTINAQAVGEYWVEATLAGCSFSDTIDIANRDCGCNVKMPNAFSPNGDGINDTYLPAMNCVPEQYHLFIFNRYGQLIFESTNPRFNWNGQYRGSDVPIGTYYYIFTLYNPVLMQHHKYTGSITLLR